MGGFDPIDYNRNVAIGLQPPQQIDAGTGSPPVMGGGMGTIGGGTVDPVTGQLKPGPFNFGVVESGTGGDIPGMNFGGGMGALNFGAQQDPNAPPLDQYGNPIVAPGDVAGSWYQGLR